MSLQTPALSLFFRARECHYIYVKEFAANCKSDALISATVLNLRAENARSFDRVATLRRLSGDGPRRAMLAVDPL
jgi:hypothetical protein